MNEQNRIQLFNDWAADYDLSVASTDHPFPFDGYERVLDEIVRQAVVQSSMLVLDLGVGTGNLAERFVALGCTVWGIDFSPAMLAEARAKLPQASFVQADLLGSWPATLNRRFDRVVSAYVLHEFDLATKVILLQRLAAHNLFTGGRIVVGDTAFPTALAREQAHAQWTGRWDEDEHYWAADETIRACEEGGLRTVYTQVSSCGGVFVIERERCLSMRES